MVVRLHCFSVLLLILFFLFDCQVIFTLDESNLEPDCYHCYKDSHWKIDYCSNICALLVVSEWGDHNSPCNIHWKSTYSSCHPIKSYLFLLQFKKKIIYLPVNEPSTEEARAIEEFCAILLNVPIIKVVNIHNTNPVLFYKISETTGKTIIKMQIPSKQREILMFKENFSASLGTKRPQKKLATNKGIGNRKETSPYWSFGYF